MVPGVALLPATALGGYIGYKIWPYLSKSTRDIPKDFAEGILDTVFDEEFLAGLLATTGTIFLVGLSAYTVKVIWTGESGFRPTLARLLATEALIFGLSIGMHQLAYILYDNDPYRFEGGREDVAENFSVTTFILSNLLFIPIAVSKLTLEGTDNRKTATVAGVMALTVSALVSGTVFGGMHFDFT